jgi:hypothetical protein
MAGAATEGEVAVVESCGSATGALAAVGGGATAAGVTTGVVITEDPAVVRGVLSIF